MQILVTNAKVIGDRFIATIADPIRLKSVEKFCNKEKNVIDILPYYQKRSTGRKSQNNHIWSHCKQIAALGMDYRHVEYEARCIGMGRGIRQATNPITGEPVYDLNNRPVPIDSKELDMGEATILIDVIHQIAAEHEINLIEGDEYVEENNGN